MSSIQSPFFIALFIISVPFFACKVNVCQANRYACIGNVSFSPLASNLWKLWCFKAQIEALGPLQTDADDVTRLKVFFAVV